MSKKTALLLCVFSIAAVLRFYNLGDIPVGFHRDEAFLGYNAYSILKTGRDMSGDLLPLHFRSFLYSPGLYGYFSIPFIALFGLSEFSVRFASALFGAFSIIPFYLLVEKLLNKKVAFYAAALLAINPWAINLTRVATENSIVVFFILLGSYLFVRSKLIASLACFSVTLFLYQAPRIFVPGLMVLLLLFSWKNFSQKQKRVGIIGLGSILLLVLFIFLSPTRSLRAQTVSIFGSAQTQLVTNEQLTEDSVQGANPIIARLLHNKPLGYFSTFLENYFSHWTYSFLFTDKGLPDRYRVPGSGLLYLIELPLILIGIWYLLRRNRRIGLLLLGWALLGPVGSALAFDDIPNLQRTLFTYPALAIFSAYGFYSLFKRVFVRLFVYLFICLFVIQFINYLHSYYIHQIVHRPWYRHEGYKELVTRVNELKGNYKKVVISNHESAPGVFFLFYNGYDPQAFQGIVANLKPKDFDRVNFDSYEFPEEPCPLNPKLASASGILYVNHSTCSVPSDATLIGEINRSDGSTVFRLLEVQI